MDLLENVKRIIKGAKLNDPIVDIHYDPQNNVVGHVADETFKTMSDNEAQALIWGELKRHLDGPELSRIIAIFHETLQERVERFTGYETKEVKNSSFWYHKTPDLSLFWLFVDVGKFVNDYKSFYLIVNDKYTLTKGVTFTYSKDVLEFMELKQEEIHPELFTNALRIGEAEIKATLITKYNQLTEKQGWGKDNMYYYVFGDFRLTPASKSNLMFTDAEATRIRSGLKNLDNFLAKEIIENALRASQTLNEVKKNLL